MTTDTDIQRVEERRDLKQQITELRDESDQEIIFKETSPRRVKRTIYSMRDGEPLPVPLYMAEKALDKRDPATGEYMFTSLKEKAPEYKMGTIKCFLHPDSSDQVILDEIGLSGMPCPKKTLKNPHSKRMHALHRHPEEWLAYQDFLDGRKEAEATARQDAQLEATLVLAGKAARAPSAPPGAVSACPEEGCAYQGTKRQIQGHKMGAHKAEAATPL